jgi:hypothetical protein
MHAHRKKSLPESARHIQNNILFYIHEKFVSGQVNYNFNLGKQQYFLDSEGPFEGSNLI